jgi:hypothetical protein
VRARTILLALAAALLTALLGSASQAGAAVPIENFGVVPSTSQAGGHPDLQFAATIKPGYIQQAEEGLNSTCDCENARFIIIHAPQGLVGSPQSLPTCTAVQLATNSCPVDSQVGVIEAGVKGGVAVAAVYNMVPREGEAGLFAFSALGVQVFEVFSSRTDSDYGLDNKTALTSFFIVRYFNQILWGVPADPSHDKLRFRANSFFGSLPGVLCDENGTIPIPSLLSSLTGPLSGPTSATRLCGIRDDQTGASSNSPLTPFTENPTSCGTPLTTTVDVVSYDGTTTHAQSAYPATTGCDQLSFNPSLAAKPTTTSADSPSGLDAELSVPQYESPSVPSPSEIKATKMILPPGFTINANAADGKGACSDTEASFGTTEAAHCPETSKIGTIEIHTALLPGPLPGYIYLGQPLSGSRYRVFLAADGFNVHVKLAGTIVPDPVTGQLTIFFNDLPETPFSDFTIHIFGSERGSLATPIACGTYPVVTTFTPWDTLLGEQTSVQHFTIDSGPNGGPCPVPSSRPFGPGFEAGSLGNTAGAHSPFSLDLSRPDGDQDLTGLSLTTPLGFSADLSGIPYCPEAAIARLADSGYSGLSELAVPACPAASQVGTLTAAAGTGSKPLYVQGKLYLAGPYKGAQLSLLAVVPAVSGPYDLGVIAIRNAIEVNPVTAQVTTVSDPLPQIVAGIPLRTRSLRVDIDRAGFARNPTNCDPLSVAAGITGDQGALASRVVPYQVANCATLPYRPTLSMRLTGGLNRLGHPAIHAVLRAGPGEANTRSVSVTLPKGELLDNSHIGSVCAKADFVANTCPAGSQVGHAEVTTPLLDRPLAGSVYLRSSRSGLPDLALDLEGQLDIEAVGRVDSVNERYRASFQTVPDVPFSEIDLSLAGGHKGLLQNSESLCGARKFAAVRLLGQNGRPLDRRVRLEVPCGHPPNRRGLHRAVEAHR